MSSAPAGGLARVCHAGDQTASRGAPSVSLSVKSLSSRFLCSFFCTNPGIAASPFCSKGEPPELLTMKPPHRWCDNNQLIGRKSCRARSRKPSRNIKGLGLLLRRRRRRLGLLSYHTSCLLSLERDL